MPIFDMYGGRQNLYTEDETDRINNPEKYNYDQAQYDAFIASLDAKVKSRQAVDARSREIIPTSYANFGTAGTNPGFSLAGMAAHTSGGLAGNAGTAQYAEGGRVEQEGIGALFEQEMLQKQIAELGLRPVTETTEEVRKMGYEDLNDFRRARIAQGQLGNWEFEREIRNYMGPRGASAIDASRSKTLFTTPKNYRGIYYHPQQNETYKEAIEDIRAREKKGGWEKLFQENDMVGGEPDMVYIVAAENANPRTLAHEFLHRAGLKEKETHLVDAWLSRTPEGWKDSVTRHRNYDQVYRGATSSPFSSYEEAEQDLLKRLQEARPELLAAEVDAMEKQHQANLASLDEKGIPYTFTEEQEQRRVEQNLTIRTDMADFRSRSRKGNKRPGRHTNAFSDGGEVKVTDQNVQRLKEALKKEGINKLYEWADSLGVSLPSGIGVDSAADVITNEFLSRANIPIQKHGDALTLQKQLPKGINLGVSFNPTAGAGGIQVSGRFQDGGVVRGEDPVQYMELGGMASPYADPMKAAVQQTTMGPQLGEQPLGPRGQMGGQQGGVGGLFQKMHQNQMGMMQAQMGGAPLQVYGEYLNNIYTAPEAESSQAQVAEFIDMVDQAERAHFGAEESFGYGGGAYQQGLMSQYQQDIPQPLQTSGRGESPSAEEYRVY